MTQALDFQAAVMRSYQQALRRQRLSRANLEKMLNAEQRCALAKLAVFPGCFDVHAAAIVFASGDWPAAQQPQPQHLMQCRLKVAARLLLDLQMRSVLSYEARQRRYRVHPSMRGLAAELWQALSRASQQALAVSAVRAHLHALYFRAG